MAMSDPVREFLRQRGAPAHLVEGGLDALLQAWEQIVQSVESGYLLDLDDYLNDMDVRQLIEESLLVATDAQRKEAAGRLEKIDEQMRAQVEPTSACLWGAEVAHEEGWKIGRAHV